MILIYWEYEIYDQYAQFLIKNTGITEKIEHVYVSRARGHKHTLIYTHTHTIYTQTQHTNKQIIETQIQNIHTGTHTLSSAVIFMYTCTQHRYIFPTRDPGTLPSCPWASRNATEFTKNLHNRLSLSLFLSFSVLSSFLPSSSRNSSPFVLTCYHSLSWARPCTLKLPLASIAPASSSLVRGQP